MKVAFVNPPITSAPMFSKDFDSFVSPLSYLCLTAKLLEHGGFEPLVLDCQSLRMGFASLRTRLEAERPDAVCIGPKMTFVQDAARIFGMVKEIDPGITTIGGGYFYSDLTESSLRAWPIDYIVRWEGEESLLALLLELQSSSPDPSSVAGICYLEEDGRYHTTPVRPLVQDLDSLPLPAYLALPNHADYGRPDQWPGTIVLQHSRGCPATCAYCNSWDLEGEHTEVDGQITRRPRYRSKSVARQLDEIEALQERFGHDYFVFVDSTWNADPRWNRAFAEGLLERDLGIEWYAFLRGDYLLRDHDNGVFPLMVESGLRYIFVGVERGEDEDLLGLDRKFHVPHQTERVCKVLKESYPQVVRTGAILIGTENESEESMMSLFDYAVALDMDFLSAYAVTPNPGSPMWHEAKRAGRLETEVYEDYNWIFPVMRSAHLSRQQIYDLGRRYYVKLFMARPLWLLRGLFARGRFVRQVYLHMIVTAFRIVWHTLPDGTCEPWWRRRPSWIEA